MVTKVFSNKYEVMLDTEDSHLLEEYNWHINVCQKRPYLRARINIEDGLKKYIFFQHLILGKPPRGKRIFFKDSNSLNLQKSNIEIISCSKFSHITYKKKENNKNLKKDYKGVSVQFVARIKIKNKIKTLGYFENIEDAAHAYNRKAKELYGNNAILNSL